MFLKPLITKNPRFVEEAIAGHQAGEIAANSFVIDLDALAANTELFVAEARRRDLTVYAMTKQVGRGPAVLDVLTGAGVDGFVAVDMACARPIVHNGHNLGHLGHLGQVPRHETTEAAAMAPDYWTVFSRHKAADAAAAAQRLGRTQDILLRVFDEGDEFYAGHEGGVALADLDAAIDDIGRLEGASFAGVTTFPALLFDPATGGARTTPNLATLARAVEMAERRGAGDGRDGAGGAGDRVQVNAPGTTSVTVLDLLAEAGATQVEPGHGLTGTTPLHASGDLPEQPAVLYLSEVSHIHQGTPLCFGGGLYVDPVFGPYDTMALVARDRGDIDTEPVPVDMPDPAAIDYYARLHPGRGRTVGEGDTVVFGFRAQAFVTRATVTGLSGVTGDSPKVVGHWNGFGEPVRCTSGHDDD